MRRWLRFVVLLVLGLGALAWLAHGVLTRKTRGWFEVDVALRARAVVSSARQGLVASWSDPGRLRDLLTEIARDERIMAVAACDPVRGRVAATEDFPSAFSCRS